MSFIQPVPCDIAEDLNCCPTIVTGYCLSDGTPIAITLLNGVLLTWTNLTTGVVTPGPPPPGAGVCSLSTTDFSYPQGSSFIMGNSGAFVLAVRNDAGTALSSDQEYIPFTTDSTGALRVTVSGGGGGSVTQTGRDDTDNQPSVATGLLTSVNRTYVFDGATWDRWTGSINDGGGSITIDGTVGVSGTVAVTQSTSPWVTSLDAASLSALESITVQNGSGAAAVNIQDGGNSITVDGTVGVSGTVATNYERAEDSGHSSGNIGAFVLAVRNDAGTPLAADQDYIPFTTDATGALRVTGGGGGGSVTQTGRDDTDDQSPVATGLLTSVSRTYVFDGSNWDRWTGAINDGGGSITVDGTVAVTQSTSPWVTSLDAASLAALESITVQNGAGAAAVNIQDGGNSITVDGAVSVSGTVTADTNYDFAEDSPHTTGDQGAFILGVRNDTAATMTSSDGDYGPVSTDASGRIGISDLGGSISIDDNGGSITVDGTVAVTQSTSPWVTSLDAASLSALESITVQNGAGAAAVNIQDGGNSITVDGTVAVTQSTSPWVTSLDAASLSALESITVQNGAGAAAVNIQDGGNSITVDGAVTVSGTVTADTNFDYAEDSAHTTGEVGAFILGVRNDAAATRTSTDGDYGPISTDAAGRVGISDLGGSITVDGTVAVTQSTSPWVTSLDAASLSALESITVQNGAGAAAVNIQDGGNSITVDGSVSITGTVDTELPAASALADNEANPSVPRVGAMNMVFDGTTWDRWTGAITDGGGSITVDGTVALDAATLTALESITVQNGAGAAAVNIQDGGNSITVDGTVSISGTVTTDNSELPAASALADNDPNPTTTRIGANNLIWDGSNWDRWTGAVTQGTSPWVIGDGGGSITVDGSVTVSGTVTADTELPAASALADNDPNPTTSRIGANNLIWDGSTWDRWTGAVTQGTSPWVTSLDAASLSALESITVQNGSGASAVNIQDGGNSITVDGAVTVSGTVATNAERAEDAAHSSGQTGNFVLAVRNDTQGSMVDTNGDYAPLQVDSAGFLRVNVPDSSTVASNARTTVGTTAVSLLAAASTRRRFFVQNVGTTIIYLGLGGTAPTTSVYYVALPPGSVADDGKGGTYIDELWVGQVQAIGSGAGGAVAITELT